MALAYKFEKGIEKVNEFCVSLYRKYSDLAVCEKTDKAEVH